MPCSGAHLDTIQLSLSKLNPETRSNSINIMKKRKDAFNRSHADASPAGFSLKGQFYTDVVTWAS